ncbi:TPA: hypothetical protein ACVS3C_001238 [Enterobacter hormaechei]|uniref:hypothetical protein n=1 Tax=Enterobacter cloacae complex TaxID=354276 RepID=UPI000755B760|nr:MULTISPECIES: hypothetical protein [Enterobacter cloacae complex]EKS7210453.1 hypothetical protein [Enterobacter ludwigii]HDR2842707.1 hypothetical protein [Enterobacter sichuanensis]EHN8936943.1 hypothetical protein [Enterobacter hormaechei]ELH1424161.1 hypothetical protein [Enterobacter hormaechei]KVJ97708.1 hypothetical protein AWS21_04370 [Enterobacter hormaechei subsp. steigerwaltii]
MKMNAGTLLDYLNATLENSNDHAQEHPQLMYMVLQMDQIFQKEIFDNEFDVSPITGFLAMNSYSMLLSAVGQALSGHLVAVFPIVRTALESACYAYLIAHNEAMEQIWLNRHKTESALHKCRKMFSVKKASNELKSISPEMAEYVMANYEAAIDFGAHPNNKAIFNHLTDMGEVDERFHGFQLTGVYGRNSWHVNYALLICTEVGQAIAFLLAACADKHPLIHDRLEVFTSWVDEKNRIVDKINGEPMDYTGSMYCSVIPPE